MMNADVGDIETGIYKISHSPYELKFLPNYSRTGFIKRNGSLLRIQDSEGCFGYADLHQWPLNFASEQSRLSLQSAEKDLFFRKEKQSIWSQFLDSRVENNYLLVNFTDESENAICEIENELSQAVAIDFRFVKVKMGKNLELELSRLQNLMRDFPAVHWRLDFNAALSYQQAQDLFSQLSSTEISKIEYVEDPSPYNFLEWSDLNKKIPLAFDQPVGINEMSLFSEANVQNSFQHLILKPALQNTGHLVAWAIENNKKITVTSFMDHPLGQAQAFHQTLQIKKKLGAKAQEFLNVCGLRTQFLFSKNEFSNEIENSQSSLLFPSGTGFGFDQQLRSLQWLQLN